MNLYNNSVFNTINKVHVIGIGGIGVSAVAQWFKHLGKDVSGCDCENSPWIAFLKKKKITIKIGHDKKHINETTDLVIYSLAIPKKHPELKKARKLGINCMSYPEAMAVFTKHYMTIAVCGTHGKTTTSAMIAKILIDNNYDPNVVIGTPSADLGNSNFRPGKSKILLLEACEYMNAFLNYDPKIIVMTNIDHDHFDSFPTLPSYVTAFTKFAFKLSKDGYFFGNIDDKNIVRVISVLQEAKFPEYNLFTFSDKNPRARFFLHKNTINFDKKREGELMLKIPGIHNRINALSSYAVPRIFDIAPADILYALNQFEGSVRRLELKGILQGVRFYDDYGHHPTEIKATLQALRELHPHEKICVVYQPHQYSRTKYLLEEFSAAFEQADAVVVPNIYAARDSEKTRKSVSSDALVESLKKHGKNAFNGNGLEKTAEWLNQNLTKFEIVVIMGAGDVWKVYEEVKKMTYQMELKTQNSKPQIKCQN